MAGNVPTWKQWSDANPVPPARANALPTAALNGQRRYPGSEGTAGGNTPPPPPPAPAATPAATAAPQAAAKPKKKAPAAPTSQTRSAARYGPRQAAPQPTAEDLNREEAKRVRARANANLSPIPFNAALASKAASAPQVASAGDTAEDLNRAELARIKSRRSQREVQQARYGTGG